MKLQELGFLPGMILSALGLCAMLVGCKDDDPCDPGQIVQNTQCYPAPANGGAPGTGGGATRGGAAAAAGAPGGRGRAPPPATSGSPPLSAPPVPGAPPLPGAG